MRDVARVESFLFQTLGLLPEHVTQLRASHRRDRPEPPEPPEQWPTYENIVGALRQLLEKSQSGEHVYVHYSGHGGRVPTRFPALKGPMGLDECLVPVDIGKTVADDVVAQPKLRHRAIFRSGLRSACAERSVSDSDGWYAESGAQMQRETSSARVVAKVAVTSKTSGACRSRATASPSRRPSRMTRKPAA